MEEEADGVSEEGETGEGEETEEEEDGLPVASGRRCCP